MIDSRCASAACIKRRNRPEKRRGRREKGREKKRKCLVGLIAVIVGGITAHPANLAKLFISFTSKNVKSCGVWVDKCVIVVVVTAVVIGLLWIGMKRSAGGECFENRFHCDAGPGKGTRCGERDGCNAREAES
jgi:hypothetical protein